MRFQPWIKVVNSKPLLFVLLLLGIFLAACTPDENESFIQGTWFYNDLHIQQQVSESFSQTYWYFDRGTYETSTCCFVEFQQYGRYDIMESEGDKLLRHRREVGAGPCTGQVEMLPLLLHRRLDFLK